jgi:hypothetical protein
MNYRVHLFVQVRVEQDLETDTPEDAQNPDGCPRKLVAPAFARLPANVDRALQTAGGR